jgi:hypothetical protein
MRIRRVMRHWWSLTLGVLVAPVGLGAQSFAQQRLISLEVPGQEVDNLRRLDPSSWYDSTGSYLIRSTGRRLSRAPRDGVTRFDIVNPEFRAAWNSELPWSQNDGASRGSVGWNFVTRLGVVLESGPVRVILAPEIVSAENRDFLAIPFADFGKRSMWSNPFHPAPESIDLPIRFGFAPRHTTVGGQSSVSIDLGRTTFGYANDNMWWGPGMRNALLVSSNAEGIPRVFLRTRSPIDTRYGRFDAEWFVGRLKESSFFDYDSTNNSRSLAGLAVTWRPPQSTHVELGFGRLVMTPLVNDAMSLGAAFDVFHDVGRPNTAPKHPSNYTAPDQLFSIFGRLTIPERGFEAWAEWARTEQPAGLRDLLEDPAHSQLYTIGAQAVHTLADTNSRLRVRIEGSYLEPSPSSRFKPLLTSYTSHAVLQGFTQDGQMLGPAIGPGSSSQFISVDYVRRRWNAGAFAGRIRYDNATLFEDIVPPVKNADVSLYYGLRGQVIYRGLRIGAEFQSTVRLNYLFQSYNKNLDDGQKAGIDLRNRTLSLVISPANGF